MCLNSHISFCWEGILSDDNAFINVIDDTPHEDFAESGIDGEFIEDLLVLVHSHTASDRLLGHSISLIFYMATADVTRLGRWDTAGGVGYA